MKTENLQTIQTKEVLLSNALETAMPYNAYRELVTNHVESETSTGPNQTDALINYTKLNDARMRRLDKTTKISEAYQTLFSNYKKKVTWLVLTESWCGDAAQSLPILNKIAAIVPHLNLKVVLRDEHIDLMQYFLTNGAMAIPKLIAIDDASRVVLGTWGPRPSVATQMAANYKATHGTLTPQFKEELQGWYTKDKGLSIVADIEGLLQ
jgi:hypothetical protein